MDRDVNIGAVAAGVFIGGVLWGAHRLYEHFTSSPQLWREYEWTQRNYDALQNYMIDYTTRNAKINRANVVLFGRSGSGKSSLVNSLNSATKKEKASMTPESYDAEMSITIQLRMFPLRTKDNKELNIRLFDTRGFQIDCWNETVFNDLLEGRFKTQQKISLDMEVGDPSEIDEVHVVAFVVDITMELDHNLKQYIDIAHRKGLTAFLLVTKVDKWMEKDIKHIFAEKDVKEKIHNLSHFLGITMQYVFPIRNYHKELNTDRDIDILNLTALEAMTRAATDRIASRNN